MDGRPGVYPRHSRDTSQNLDQNQALISGGVSQIEATQSGGPPVALLYPRYVFNSNPDRGAFL